MPNITLDLTKNFKYEDQVTFICANNSLELILPEPFDQFFQIRHLAMTYEVTNVEEGKFTYLLNAFDSHREAQCRCFVVLAHLIHRTTNIYFFQRIWGASEKRTVTIVDPKYATVWISPLSLLEVVLLGVEDPYYLPTIRNANKEFLTLELLRKEYIPADDLCYRHIMDTFGIQRWKIGLPQHHFFFRLPEKDLRRIRHLSGRFPLCNIDLVGAGSVSVELYIREPQREELLRHLTLDKADFLKTEASRYGITPGSFYGNEILGCNTQQVEIPRNIKSLVVEMPLTVKTTNRPVPPIYRWSHKLRKPRADDLLFEATKLDIRIVNDTVLERFRITDICPTMNAYGRIHLGNLELNAVNSFKKIEIYQSWSNTVNDWKKTSTALPIITPKSQPKQQVNKVSFVPVGSNLAKNCLTYRSGSKPTIDATKSEATKVVLDNPQNHALILLREDQKLFIRLQLIRVDNTSSGIWNHSEIPFFLTPLGVKKEAFTEVFEFEVYKKATTKKGKIYFILKNLGELVTKKEYLIIAG